MFWVIFMIFFTEYVLKERWNSALAIFRKTHCDKNFHHSEF
jgi:hypothetical protein